MYKKGGDKINIQRLFPLCMQKVKVQEKRYGGSAHIDIMQITKIRNEE